jgi:enoyl-CoA hydratase/3-hydroxyacyl-CoA dehydrogenase
VLPEDAVLATNTSTLPITEIAEATDRPERVVGIHFSNPVQLMPVVEVIRGERTAEEVFALAEALSERLGKTPVLVERDVPGFLLNRINYAFWSEAIRRVDEGETDPEAVDALVRRLGFPMGSFEVLDFSGIDVFVMAAKEMRDRGVDVHVPGVLKELVDAGRYGVKAGEGFYEYPEPGQYTRVALPRERRYEFNPRYLMASAVNEAAWLLENDVTTKEDIDTAVRVGMNWPRGLLAFADEYGIDRLVETLTALHEATGRDRYEPNPLLEEMVAADRLGTKTGEGFYEYGHEAETFGTVEYERREFVAVITLSRPGKLNAMDEPSWLGLREALERAAEDDDVRSTVIGGRVRPSPRATTLPSCGAGRPPARGRSTSRPSRSRPSRRCGPTRSRRSHTSTRSPPGPAARWSCSVTSAWPPGGAGSDSRKPGSAPSPQSGSPTGPPPPARRTSWSWR